MLDSFQDQLTPSLSSTSGLQRNNMTAGDTSAAGPNRAFPHTTWAMVARLRDPSNTRYLEGLETLCRRYWKPAYTFIRIAWAKSNEDAWSPLIDFRFRPA